MGQQASIPTDLSREVQVIGAGFSRTGTVSFALELERLLQGPDDGANEELIERNLRDLTAGYVATTDTSAILFSEELARLHPEALVICSTRDQESWWRSAQALMENTGLWWLDLVFLPMPTLRLFGRWRDTIGERLEKVYRTSKQNLDGPRLLEFHESYIRRVVPPERLFFFNVKDSWEPLCRILSCPVPNEPFPRANDGQAMQGFFENMLKAAVVRWMQIFVVGGACIAMGVWGAERSLCINCRI
ncbi:unnamed protein product [Diplocarpon coronariae]